MHFRFPEVQRSGRDVVKFDGLRKAYGENVIYDGVSQSIERGQRIAVIGSNGAGKTTLLKMLAGELQPDAGSVTLGHNVIMGYYAQHHADTLDPKSSIVALMRRLVPDKPESHVRSILGAFLFSGDDVEKPIGVLSGGERARVALARLLLVPANLLVMDEPTNHLDLDSSEMLIEALQHYEGTLIFVSHNRSFINGLASHVWEVKDQQVHPHPGNLDDWLHHQEQLQLAAAAAGERPVGGKASAPQPRPPRRPPATRSDAASRPRSVSGAMPWRDRSRRRSPRIEARIAALETTLKEHEAQLADPVLYNDFARAKPLMDAHRDGKEELDGLYARWEASQEQLAALA